MILSQPSGEAPVEKLCIENPVDVSTPASILCQSPNMSSHINYGEDASKKTGFVAEEAAIQETEYIEPRYVDGKPRWSNQGDTGYDKFGGGQGKERMSHSSVSQQQWQAMGLKSF